jgi:hypothetical protein
MKRNGTVIATATGATFDQTNTYAGFGITQDGSSSPARLGSTIL